MASLSLAAMRQFLSTSVTSGKSSGGVVNKNKIHGLLAEVYLRQHLTQLGFGDRVSVGGWISRSESRGGLKFGEKIVALFPETILPEVDLSPNRPPPVTTQGLHTIGSTFHTLGINSFFCFAEIGTKDDAGSVAWKAVQLGLPQAQQPQPLVQAMSGFGVRPKPWNFLRNKTDVQAVIDVVVPEEFTKENLRVSFQSHFYTQTVDVDGLFWGQQYTYPMEVKEKTVANEPQIGDYFGLDVGPFVKLSFYAAKRGNLHSLFIVREINNTTDRKLVNWWYTTFDEIAQYGSWVLKSGGASMGGGASAVVPIPKWVFKPLDKHALAAL
ncbi:hypothetical protein BH09PLA1_BH09PLA1_01400 [soil metagenome]